MQDRKGPCSVSAKRNRRRKSKNNVSLSETIVGFALLVAIAWGISHVSLIIRVVVLVAGFILIIAIAFPGISKIRNPYLNVDMSKVDSMNGHEFEHYCAYLLEWFGYRNIHVTPGSGDQGVDIVAGRDGSKYAFQCKCYANKIGNKPVQEVFAGKTFYNCDNAVVVTNNYFTDSAVRLAQSTNVELWDRDTLRSMMYKIAEAQESNNDGAADNTIIRKKRIDRSVRGLIIAILVIMEIGIVRNMIIDANKVNPEEAVNGDTQAPYAELQPGSDGEQTNTDLREIVVFSTDYKELFPFLEQLNCDKNLVDNWYMTCSFTATQAAQAVSEVQGEIDRLISTVPEVGNYFNYESISARADYTEYYIVVLSLNESADETNLKNTLAQLGRLYATLSNSSSESITIVKANKLGEVVGENVVPVLFEAVRG